MDGLLIVDKPIGPTSHDVVASVRRVLHERRIGHTGTLDPLASGVLPLVIGRATRLARFLSASHKSYRATVRLGWSTDSGDADGQRVGEVYDGAPPGRERIEQALNRFRGSFLQQPPVFSAKKIGGVRSHEMARRNAATAPLPEPAEVSTERLELLSVRDNEIELDIRCSAGFYVRSLAHDLGAGLGTGAHLTALRRTASGAFGLDRAIPLADLLGEGGDGRALAALIPLSSMLPDYPAVTLTDDGVRRAKHGQMLTALEIGGAAPPPRDGVIRLLTPAGDLLGLAEDSDRPGILHPALVLM